MNIRERRDELLAEERDNACRWYWLSFVGESGFLGGCFVLAPGPVTAIKRADDLGINPGGEVLSVPATAPPPEMRGRLLDKADLDTIGGWARV